MRRSSIDSRYPPFFPLREYHNILLLTCHFCFCFLSSVKHDQSKGERSSSHVGAKKHQRLFCYIYYYFCFPDVSSLLMSSCPYLFMYVSLLGTFTSTHKFWSLDRTINCLIQWALANHKDCRFMFKSDYWIELGIISSGQQL